MSLTLIVDSVCGSYNREVDVFDLDYYPEGIVCCDNCKSILATRESWMSKYWYFDE